LAPLAPISKSRQLDCFDEQTLTASTRGQLSPSKELALSQHAANCSACRTRLLAAATNASAAEDSHLLGGKYLLGPELGSGGMGTVYQATNTWTGRRVAIKVMNRYFAAEEAATQRFMREARSSTRISHPVIVDVLDLGQEPDGTLYMVQEYLTGETLRQRLKARGKFPVPETLAIMTPVIDALVAAHEAGVLHRDIKPANIFLADSGIKLIDFGISKLTNEPESTSLTARGHMLGTPSYMSPEQLRAEEIDARSDIWSVAVVLYELVAGVRPFPARTSSELAVQILREPIPALLPYVPSTENAFAAVIEKAMQRDRERRFRTMRAMRDALARSRTQAPDAALESGITAADVSLPTREGAVRIGQRRRLRALAVAWLALVVIVTAAAYVVHLRRAALARAELWRKLGSMVPQIRTLLRSAHLLPLHDIRPERERVKALMKEVEQQLQSPAGRDARDLGMYVSGEGYLALGDNERALELLTAAWNAGERGSEIDAALGHALGNVYERKVEEVELTIQSGVRDKQIRELETRYRDPALAHLRAAVGLVDVSTAYLEALILFHQHRFSEARDRASAAFSASPTSYESGVLEASARQRLAEAIWRAGRVAEAQEQFAETRRSLHRVLEIARSDDGAWIAFAEALLAQAELISNRGEVNRDLRNTAIVATRSAQQINPENAAALLQEARVYSWDARLQTNSGDDPRENLERVLNLAKAAMEQSPIQASELVCEARARLADYQGLHGIDPRSTYDAAIVACRASAALSPSASSYTGIARAFHRLGTYESRHGIDPTHAFELASQNIRAALAIEESADRRNSLGGIWTLAAIYRANHGQNPAEAIQRAVAEFELALQIDKSDVNSASILVQALAAQPIYQLQHGDDPRPAIAETLKAYDRAIAMDPNYVGTLEDLVLVRDVEAEYLLEQGADPSSAIENARHAVGAVLQQLPKNYFAHKHLSRIELFAARWAIRHHHAADAAITRAVTEAALARADNPGEPQALAISAEAEEVRAEYERGRRRSAAAAIARGLGFIERSMAIDPGLVHTLRVRAALLRLRASPSSN
jgi:serine/threonine-protein kinase